jgi:large subunit ribosomal protein L24
MSTKYHVKTGETVVLIAGDEKGKSGKVIQVLPKKDRVIVEGLNLIKKTHQTQSATSRGSDPRTRRFHSYFKRHEAGNL